VNQSSGDMERKKPKRPQDEQDYKNCPKHNLSPIQPLKQISARGMARVHIYSLQGWLLSRIAHRLGLGGWHSWPLFGPQKCHQLRNFVCLERVFERRHLLSAMKDLVGNPRSFPRLSKIGQRRAFRCPFARSPMTIRASLFSKQEGASLLVSLGRSRSLHGSDHEKERRRDGEKSFESV
jgi:hypothetical protein